MSTAYHLPTFTSHSLIRALEKAYDPLIGGWNKMGPPQWSIDNIQAKIGHWGCQTSPESQSLSFCSSQSPGPLNHYTYHYVYPNKELGSLNHLEKFLAQS